VCGSPTCVCVCVCVIGPYLKANLQTILISDANVSKIMAHQHQLCDEKEKQDTDVDIYVGCDFVSTSASSFNQ